MYSKPQNYGRDAENEKDKKEILIRAVAFPRPAANFPSLLQRRFRGFFKKNIFAAYFFHCISTHVTLFGTIAVVAVVVTFAVVVPVANVVTAVAVSLRM